MAGEYAELVRLAQADDDPQHRQQAMDAIATAAPYVSFHGNSPADTIAAAAIARLYPKPTPGPPDDIAVTIAAIEADARARIEQIIAAARAEHSENRAAVNGESDQQTAVTASSESGD